MAIPLAYEVVHQPVLAFYFTVCESDVYTHNSAAAVRRVTQSVTVIEKVMPAFKISGTF